MKAATINPDTDKEVARRINALHAEAERHRGRCCDAVYEALSAAWHAGHLLLKQKKKVLRGDWELWLERYFEGSARTAQRYMLLAKTVPDILQLRGFTLRQAYLRLGIAVASNPHEHTGRNAILPTHAVLMNRFQRWFRQKGDTSQLPEPEKRTLRHDLRPLYEWLTRLFDETQSSGQPDHAAGRARSS